MCFDVIETWTKYVVFCQFPLQNNVFFYWFSLQNIAKKNFISCEFETWLNLPIKAQYFCMSHVFLILNVNMLTLHRKKLLLLIFICQAINHVLTFYIFKNLPKFLPLQITYFLHLISWFLPSLFHDKHVILKLRQSSADFSQWKGNPFKKIVKAV